jgi:PAS domain S-box-containing protein
MADSTLTIHFSLLRSILDVAADPIIAIGLDQRILLFSKGAERTFGYRRDEVIGRDLGILLPAQVVETHPEFVRTFAAGAFSERAMSARKTVRAYRKNGEEFQAEVTISKCNDDPSPILLAILHDLTERQQIESALFESEQRYRTIVTAMDEGVVLQDAAGRIVTCNASAERILGLTLDQMMGLTSFDPRWQATHEDGSPAAGETHPIVITLRTGQPQKNVIMGVRRTDGAHVWISINTQPLLRPGQTVPHGVVASFTDITQARETLQALRASEARYRLLYENSLDGVLLTDPDGAILAANPAACRLLGRTEAEICHVGRTGVVDQTDPRMWAAIEERARTGKFRREMTLIRGDGSRFQAEVSSGIFIDSEGYQRTSMVFRDITESAQAYQLMERRVDERTRELAALLEASREISSTRPLSPVLEAILTQLKKVVGFTGAGITMIEGDELVMLDYTGPIPREKMIHTRISLDQDTGYRRVIEQRAPVIIDDIWAASPWLQTVWSDWGEEQAEYLRATHSWLGVPLIATGTLIGVLRLDHAEAGHFTERHARLALTFANQAAVAIENARLHQQALRAAALEERQRLARELHDSVSQTLYGIVLGSRTAAAQLHRDVSQAEEALNYVLSLAAAAFAEMRALIFELRPDSLETDGLVAAISHQIDLLQSRFGLKVHSSLTEEPELPLAVKEAIYRIVQEGTNNAAKHAQATSVMISLEFQPRGILLQISDDGHGFDATQSFPGHLGMVTMRERATGLGGTFELVSDHAQGTSIRVWIPSEVAISQNAG